ncbi:MAG: hypothetical protein ABSA41_11160 [Terriglobia bacterium]
MNPARLPLARACFHYTISQMHHIRYSSAMEVATVSAVLAVGLFHARCPGGNRTPSIWMGRATHRIVRGTPREENVAQGSLFSLAAFQPRRDPGGEAGWRSQQA